MTTLAAPRSRWPSWAAWAFCFLIFALIVGDVVRHPDKHNTTPTYRAAATAWWEGIDAYNGNEHSGFFYFPQAAFLFTPFNVLPYLTGEIVWRIFTFGIFLFALVRLNAFFLAGKNGPSSRSFLFLALLAVPSSFASLRNAQYDLPLAALVILTAAEIAQERWSMATLWLCLAIALKPLALVPLLLFGALYRPLWLRLAAGLLVTAALPFLHWNPAYVAHEYVRCYESLTQASQANEPRYSDLAALLSKKLHYNAPQDLKTSVRVVAAFAYFGLGLVAMRRLRLPASAWAVGALAADYLMLFNPRTETCSYVFLGPFVASLALLCAGRPTGKWLAGALGFAALGFACDAFPKLGTFSVHDLTDRWLKPLLALLFLPVLIAFIFGRLRVAEPKR